MIDTSTIKARTVFFVVSLILLSWLPPANTQDFESPTLLKASTLLPADILKGSLHTVDEAVQNDGYLNHYQVTSPYGTFTANSDTALYRSILELSAISSMRKIEVEDVALDSMKKSGEKTIKGLQNLFTEPEDTLKGAASGMQSLFNRAKGTIGQRQVTQDEDSRVEQLVGLTKSKGEIANVYGVSIYSRNTVLQAELDRLARADFMGGLGVGLATSVVPGVGGVVLSASGASRLLNEAVNTTPASELWLQNKKKLIELGIPEYSAELFLNQPYFNPALSTMLVASLKVLGGVKNLELALQIALQATTPLMAEKLTETVVLLAWYHKSEAPLQRLETLGRLACGIKADGSAAILFPCDYLLWSERTAEIALATQNSYADKGPLELWLTGKASPRAHKELVNLGWKIREGVREKLRQEK